MLVFACKDLVPSMETISLAQTSQVVEEPEPSQTPPVSDVLAPHSHPTIQPSPGEQEVVTEMMEDSFFSKAVPHKTTAEAQSQLQPRPRPFNEIVSSVQGNFNFLQESQIDIDCKLHIKIFSSA